ncbi:hypothetical protein [Reinekea marinisedimentorum]|uniref:Uncharacterized protein n=1 Tax=Reinekea marinisedimentorum TaxID=230495 RepID=A0A4R3I9Y9_9GAMM|nr:hypothetical protein [Reinekea marinisedimentorum]TCS42698.1 hypothetical protein BCF53_103368 [Reinekea marinisedimentorum]
MPAIDTNQPSSAFYHSEYRNCEIVINYVGEQYSGEFRVHGKTMGSNTAETFEATLQSLRSSADQYHYMRQQNREDGVLSPADYISAVQAIWRLLKPSQRRLLLFHMSAADYQCEVDQLLEVAELHSTIQLLLSYADIARKLSDELAYIPPTSPAVIDPIICVLMTPTGVLTNRSDYDDMRTLQLRPEVAKALESINGYRPT